MPAPTPGTQFIETRPVTGGARFVLVEIGRVFDGPAMELIDHGFCDETGRLIEAHEFGPMTFEVPKGFCGTADFRAVATARREAA